MKTRVVAPLFFAFWLASAIAQSTLKGENTDSQPTGESRWPPNMENLLYEHLAHYAGLQVISIDSVSCDDTTCEVVFVGAPGNEIEDYERIEQSLWFKPWTIGSMSFGGRDIAPGVKEVGLRISNVPIDPETLRELKSDGVKSE